MLLLHGFVAQQSLLDFVVKQTCFLEWSLTYRGLPYFFLYLQSPSGINYLITYFVPLLYPYQSDVEIVSWSDEVTDADPDGWF